jgi:hypothetical protein
MSVAETQKVSTDFPAAVSPLMSNVQGGRNCITELKDKPGHLHAVAPVIDNFSYTFIPCLNILNL